MRGWDTDSSTPGKRPLVSAWGAGPQLGVHWFLRKRHNPGSGPLSRVCRPCGRIMPARRCRRSGRQPGTVDHRCHQNHPLEPLPQPVRPRTLPMAIAAVSPVFTPVETIPESTLRFRWGLPAKAPGLASSCRTARTPAWCGPFSCPRTCRKGETTGAWAVRAVPCARQPPAPDPPPHSEPAQEIDDGTDTGAGGSRSYPSVLGTARVLTEAPTAGDEGTGAGSLPLDPCVPPRRWAWASDRNAPSRQPPRAFTRRRRRRPSPGSAGCRPRR